MTASEILDQGRAGFERHLWGQAYDRLSAADQEEPLSADDLERLAVAAQMVGEDEASAECWERAHLELLQRDEVARAVRCAFWLALGLFSRGEMARGGGWLTRAQHLLDDHQLDCAERGFLLVPMALGTMEGGDDSGAYGMFSEALEVGQRFGEPDLETLGRLGQGRALVRMDQTDEGLGLLDEAMVAVTAEEVSPVVMGIVYCTVILVCQQAFDLRRAHEWTAALSDWCDARPDMVPFRGQCLVHRSEIMQARGEWAAAMEEVQRARERLSDPPGQPALGMAFYQQGELHRLRGEFVEAERAYRQANQRGREPQPGMAQLRLAQGQVEAAEAAIRRVVDETASELARAKMLPAYVEIMLTTGNVEDARAAAEELASTAAEFDAPVLRAWAAGCTGLVLLSDGDPRSALEALREACSVWSELEAPYEHARARVLVALACRDLGDRDTAELEVDAARRVFEHLGAVPDQARLDELFGTTADRASDELTARQTEVLALVAMGMTNQEIADQLTVSEHTVRRHLQNVFAKLGVSSRAAATAYALEHELI